MLASIVDLLRCPRCADRFTIVDRSLRCSRGHVFDIARQGYANLTGAAQPANADSPDMVAARAELLGSGRYAVISGALLAATPGGVTDVLDVGTGTGHYAAALLDARPGARALGLDVSVAACRRAARAHARLGVVTADAWHPLPVADHAVDLVLSVFSPRNPDEFSRVLRPGGSVITVVAAPDHLRELRTPLGLLGVEPGKEERLAEIFLRAGLASVDRRELRSRHPWPVADAVRSILMGPNAFHSEADRITAAAAQLEWPRPVTVSVVISRWQPAG